jgi:hypothetical protein
MDFSLRTIEELFENIKQIALREYPDKTWSGLTYGSIQWVIGRILAEQSQNVLYALDIAQQESYIDTAQLHSSMRLIAQLYGISFTERTGATVGLTFIASDDVVVPRGTQVNDSTGKVFCTLEELTLSAAGSLTGSVRAVHSDYTQQTYTAAGDQNEEIATGITNVLPYSTAVLINGVEWTRVDNFASSGSTDNHYRIIIDSEGLAIIQFGDGTYGKRLSTGDEITLDIFSGGGFDGNGVAIGELSNLRSVFTGSSHISSVTNTDLSSGGGVEDSIDKIKASLQSRNASLSGIISNAKSEDTITSELSWVAGSTIETGYDVSSGIAIPTAILLAFPRASSLQSLTAGQIADLTTLLENRGEFGVDWSVESARINPLEIEIDAALINRAKENETETQIKNAINTDDGAPFSFDSLTFNIDLTQQEILQKIEAVSNVKYATIKKLACKPQTYIHTGVSNDGYFVADVDLGDNAEDGYVEFVSTATDGYADARFLIPFKPDVVASGLTTSYTANFLAEKFEFGDDELSDSGEAYIKEVAGKLWFKQNTKIWKADQFNGTYWNDKYLLYITWAESGAQKSAWYHIDDTTDTIIKTVENAASPISGTAITTLDGSDYTNIKAYIVRDLSQGVLVSANGNQYTITHNNANTIYTSEASIKLPVGKYSHVLFAEAPLDISTGSWIANSDVLRIRCDTAGSFSQVGAVIHFYITPQNAKHLQYKNKKGVYTLSNSNITINWI